MLIVVSKRKVIVLTLVLLLVLSGWFASQQIWPGFPSRAVSALVNFNRLVPIYCVQTDEKRIAISFDAAWGADRTDELLQILDEYQVKTTFFLVGFWLESYPEVARRISAEGHEIGNHSATHPHMSSLSAEQIRFELQSTHELIREITGQDGRLFRPPFGEYNNRLIMTAEETSYLTIQWSVDSLDWRPLSAAEIAERVTKRIEPGSIVLFHNNGEQTPTALRSILEFCRREGYEIVPISELLLKGEYYIDKSNGMMRPR